MGFVTVHRSSDPIEIDLLADQLREGGIEARVLGTRDAAVIGVGQSILELSLQVPSDVALEATEFLEAYFAQDGGELLRAAGQLDDDDSETVEPEPPRRSHLLAGGAAILILGTSHLYSGRFLTASCIAVGQIMALRSLASQSWSEVSVGLVVFATLLVADVVGGQCAVAAFNRGIRRGLLVQALAGALMLLVAFAMAALIAPQLPVPELE